MKKSKISKRNSYLIISAFILLAMFQINAQARIYILTLLEKTRASEFIFLAKCVNISDEKYKITSPKLPDKKIQVPRFAAYKIIEVWKGEYDKNTITLDYKFTNEKYKPIICSPSIKREIDEQVVLFIEKDMAIFHGFQGKIQVDEKSAALYRDAVKKFRQLDILTEKEKVLAIIEMVDSNNLQVRESMLRDLREVDNNIYGVEIAHLLEHEDTWIRQSAISALIGTEKKEVSPFVIKVLKDPNPGVRADAADVLKRIDDENITAFLIEAFNDESGLVRRRVVSALSYRLAKEAIPTYLKAFKDNDPLVRVEAVYALSHIKGSKPVPKLLLALKDENARVRQAAVSSLRLYASADIINPVSELLVDEDWGVREYAASCITRIANRGHRELLKKDKIIDDLLRMVEKEERVSVKTGAIYALGAIGTERAIPILLNLLSDTQIEIRSSSAHALSGIGNKDMLPHLRKALENESNEYVANALKNAISQLEK